MESFVDFMKGRSKSNEDQNHIIEEKIEEPVIEKVQGGMTVKVGSVAHPMEEKHYITWIEVIADGKAYRQFLKPGDAPEAYFPITSENIIVREYCNLHGLWRAES